ncbi:MAG: hypothetical protein WC661_10190 [Opitutaceae bacterium]|jgi:hypothetical protein
MGKNTVELENQIGALTMGAFKPWQLLVIVIVTALACGFFLVNGVLWAALFFGAQSAQAGLFIRCAAKISRQHTFQPPAQSHESRASLPTPPEAQDPLPNLGQAAENDSSDLGKIGLAYVGYVQSQAEAMDKLGEAQKRADAYIQKLKEAQ